MRVHLDSNDERGLDRHCAEFLRVEGPDGHDLSMQGPTLVARWLYPDAERTMLVFGRTRAPISNYRSHTGNILWDGASIDEAGARRIVAYALRRGWQVTECTAGHPLADILPDGWGTP